jgi:hypothetical protein
MKLHATNKHTILVDEIATGSKHDKATATATAAFADKIEIITEASATIQIVVNQTMLKSLGELLTPEKKGGLVLPKPHLSCAEHYDPGAKITRKPQTAFFKFRLRASSC